MLQCVALSCLVLSRQDLTRPDQTITRQSQARQDNHKRQDLTRLDKTITRQDKIIMRQGKTTKRQHKARQDKTTRHDMPSLALPCPNCRLLLFVLAKYAFFCWKSSHFQRFSTDIFYTVESHCTVGHILLRYSLCVAKGLFFCLNSKPIVIGLKIENKCFDWIIFLLDNFPVNLPTQQGQLNIIN